MTIILFLAILAILVLVHELGHFIVAKKSGIRVDEFGLGFPPKAWSKKIGETVYSLNFIPFGGFVKIFGENPDDESINGPDSSRSFVKKNRLVQASVLIAGIVFNIAFAWLLISASFMFGLTASEEDYGTYSQFENPRVVITSVARNSPAEVAGLKANDSFARIETATQVLEGDALSVENIQNTIAQNKDKEMTIVVKRDGNDLTIPVTPTEGLMADRAVIGIGLDKVGFLRLPPHLAIWEGARLTLYMVEAVTVGLTGLITDLFKGQADLTQVTGPVGIAGLVGDASRLGVTYLLMFTAFISINLAIINLVPFPALDGGRLLFVLIEAIRRKPINPKVANTANAIGFVLLITLMIVITYRDIARLF